MNRPSTVKWFGLHLAIPMVEASAKSERRSGLSLPASLATSFRVPFRFATSIAQNITAKFGEHGLLIETVKVVHPQTTSFDHQTLKVVGEDWAPAGNC
jgi:hypothetical protein